MKNEDLELDNLIKQAVELIVCEDKEKWNEIIERCDNLSISDEEIERLLEPLRPSLALLRARSAFRKLIDSGERLFFWEYVRKARQGTDNIEPALNMINLSLEELNCGEKNQQLLLDLTDLSVLVKLMNLFGVHIHEICHIVSIEERKIALSGINFDNAQWGILENTGIRYDNLVRPSIVGFLARLRDEIGRQGLCELIQ